MSDVPPPPVPRPTAPPARHAHGPPAPIHPGFWRRVLTPAAAVLAGFGIAIPVAALLLAGSASEETVTAVFAITGGGLIALFGLLILRGLPRHERRLALAAKRSPTGSVAIGALIGIAIIVGSATLIVLGTLVDDGLRDRLEERAIDIGVEPWQIVLMVVALVILAPLGEELIFRALLLRALVRRLAFWPAALISALLFAAAHADAYALWPRAIALVLTGLVLAWVYRRRGYWAAVAAHATVNGVAAVALIAAG